MRRLAIAVALANAVLIVALGVSVVRARGDVWNGTRLDPPMPTQPFQLESSDGPVGSEDLRGNWSLVFFGYTRCPDACPLTLDKLRRVMADLGRRADDVQVALVTVDPEHDTADVLAEYVTRFDPRFVGLTADRAAIEELARAYGVHHAARGAPEASATHADHSAHASHDGHDEPSAEPTLFLVDHTTHVFVLDPNGDLAMLWGPEVTAEQMANDLRRLLRR